jgi:DNA-binding NarL/FixJ family response regulator
MMEDSLKASGSLYHTEKVTSGKDCLIKLQKEKFDILLLDHALSDGDGLDWLRRFNELGIGIPTIFVTAKGWACGIARAQSMDLRDHYNICPCRRVCHAICRDLCRTDGPIYFFLRAVSLLKQSFPLCQSSMEITHSVRRSKSNTVK